MTTADGAATRPNLFKKRYLVLWALAALVSAVAMLDGGFALWDEGPFGKLVVFSLVSMWTGAAFYLLGVAMWVADKLSEMEIEPEPLSPAVVVVAKLIVILTVVWPLLNGVNAMWDWIDGRYPYWLILAGIVVSSFFTVGLIFAPVLLFGYLVGVWLILTNGRRGRNLNAA